MAKKLLVAGLLAFVGVVYYYEYRDHFERRDIQLAVTVRPKFLRGQPVLGADGQLADMVIFALGKEYKITSVKVVTVTDALLKKPHALWELTSESNSAPTIDFEYGHKIRGMRPATKGANAEPLLPNTDYRILVEAGSRKGSHDFRTPGEATAE